MPLVFMRLRTASLSASWLTNHTTPTKWEMSVKRMEQPEMYRCPKFARVCGLVAAFCTVVLVTACDSSKLNLTKFSCTMDNGDTYDITIKDESTVRINNRLLSDGGTVKIEDLAWNVTVNADKDRAVVNMQHAIGSSSMLPTSSGGYAMNYDLDNNNGTLAVEVLRDGNRERRRVGKCVKVT